MSDRALAEIDRRADFAVGEDPSLADRAERLRAVPEALRVHFWAAISWGLWGRSHRKWAAATRGVAGRIRHHARTVVLLDEAFADAGGLRLLGRLHSLTPRVPFVTGWIDRTTGLEHLRRATEISRADPRNPLFLAEALLAAGDDDRDHRAEALSLPAKSPPSPETPFAGPGSGQRQEAAPGPRPDGRTQGEEEEEPYLAYIHRFFDKWLPVYDVFALSIFPAYRAAVRALAPAPGLRVLDIGTGTGEIALRCARRGAAGLRSFEVRRLRPWPFAVFQVTV